MIDLTIKKKTCLIGRPVKCTDAEYIDAIYYTLRTGTSWNYVRGYPVTGDTIRKKFIEWSSHGIFKNAYIIMVNIYLEFNIDIDKIFLDASHIKNLFGVDSVGVNVYDRFRKSTKLSIITNNDGIPISIDIKPGNVHDSKMIQNTLKLFDNIQISYYDTQYLIADKGYYGNNISKLVADEYKLKLITPDKRSTEEINTYREKINEIKQIDKKIISETNKLKNIKNNIHNRIIDNINKLNNKRKLINNKIKELKLKRKNLNKKKRGRKTDKERLLRDRYVVERTFSWFKKYYRLSLRKDKYVSNFESFVFIGASNIISNKILDIYTIDI